MNFPSLRPAGRPLALIFTAAIVASCAQGEKHIRREVTHLAPTRSPAFRQVTALLGPNFVAGNRIVTLQNGDQIFPAMLQAIHAAKRTINFETYVYWDGEIARTLAQALAERARAGVTVHAVLDAQGTYKMGRENYSLMRDAGVDIQKYHPLFWLDPRRFNNRTHRKLLIVDGKTAFMGGVGIADVWTGHADSPEHWRDNHYKVTGPVVAQIQALFMDDWLKTSGTVLQGDDYFPPLAPTGSYLAQAFRCSPKSGDIDIALMYLLAIASAEKTLRIENAYFLPDKPTREALVHAAERGVRVEIISPGRHIDQKLVRLASRRYWQQLAKAGIKIYEYQPSMVHVKLMIVDGIFTSVGSANFDNRSIRLNDEANLNVYDAHFAAEQTRLFENDKAKSRPVVLDSGGNAVLGAPIGSLASIAAPEL